jgi:ANTAR domain
VKEPSSRTADAGDPASLTGARREDQAASPAAPGEPDRPPLAVVRRSGRGWRVDDEELPDLMSAIVFADLLAPELPGAPSPAADGPPVPAADGQDAAAEAARLQVTVAQLEHALATRVRMEQAIGIVSERRRIPARQAFELLRAAARADGTRLAELAARVVDSAVNPLLPLPEDLARPARPPRARGRSPRHVRVSE